MEMSECVVCGSGDFDLFDGLYFCSDCGTQSQVSKNGFSGLGVYLFGLPEATIQL